MNRVAKNFPNHLKNSNQFNPPLPQIHPPAPFLTQTNSPRRHHLLQGPLASRLPRNRSLRPRTRHAPRSLEVRGANAARFSEKSARNFSPAGSETPPQRLSCAGTSRRARARVYEFRTDFQRWPCFAAGSRILVTRARRRCSRRKSRSRNQVSYAAERRGRMKVADATSRPSANAGARFMD